MIANRIFPVTSFQNNLMHCCYLWTMYPSKLLRFILSLCLFITINTAYISS